MKPRRLRFFVALNTGYVTDGKPDKRFVEFYRRRSSPRLYCAIVGNVVIPGGYGTNDSTPTISSAPEWKDVASAIAERGSLPGIQLTTTWKGYAGLRSFRSLTPHIAVEQSREVVRGLHQADIKSVLQGLDDASGLAVDAGFKHLQVHAAHGYLFNLLVDDRFNKHAFEVRELLAKWAAKYSAAGAETSIRASMRTGDQGLDANGAEHIYAMIASLRFDFVDLSSGFYNIDKRLIYPGRPDVLEDRRAESVALALRLPRQDLIMSGRALLKSDEDLPTNLHIGLCRDLIANPDYLTDNSRGCENYGKCHYFSRGANHLICQQWNASPL